MTPLRPIHPTSCPCSRKNADDRFPLASLGRVQGGDGIVKGRDVADIRPQSSVPHPLDDLTQLGTIEGPMRDTIPMTVTESLT